MSAKVRVGVLISGRGSNLKSLMDACAAPDFPAEIVLVISNVADVAGLDYPSAAGIPTKVISHKSYSSREAFDTALHCALEEVEVELVCLAGFMRILSDGFVKLWQGWMINIHPSLLPAFKGTEVHERVIAAGERVSGCTVHYVTREVDSGPAILQAEVPVLETDTPDTLAARVLEKEHEIYPRALRITAERIIDLRGDMKPYKKLSGDSGVAAYKIGSSSIEVMFQGGDIYTYTYESAGAPNIERMKTLAVEGKGLSAFISQHVKKLYALKRSA